MIEGEQPNPTDQHGDAGLRWLLDRRAQWGLTDSELARLLDVSSERLLGWKKQVVSGELVTLPPYVVERIGLLLGLHKGLVILTPSGHESMAAEWFQKRVDLWGLNGESIRSFLLKDPRLTALIQIVQRIRSAAA